MLHYPCYPDGRTMQVGDIFTFDDGNQIGIITLLFPDEACYHDATIESAPEELPHTPVCDEDLSTRDIPGGCSLVPHWRQIAFWKMQENMEISCAKEAFHNEETLRYMATLDLKEFSDKLHRHLKCGYYKEDLRNVQGWLRRARKEMKS